MSANQSDVTRQEPITVTITAGDEFNITKMSNCVHRQLLIDLRDKILNSVTANNFKDGRGYRKADIGLRYTGREGNYLFTGGRGSGKSTFLRILVQLLLNKITDTDHPRNHYPRLQELCWFDPSESSGGEDYFFLSIAAALKTKLENAIKTGSHQEKDYDFLIDYCKSGMKSLDKGLVRLSCARKAISELTLQKAADLRLNTPDLDDSIRNNFYDVVDRLCDICKVDAFIIAIDDADTRSEQCFRVLEDLRLYIRHPRLIILMTGDKHMYLERIRENLFREYHIGYHQADVKGQQNRLDMVVSHASQYLIKLFPLANQRELVDMYTLMHKHTPITYNLRRKDERENAVSSNLKDLVTKLFEHTISTKADEIKPYIELFFRLPLRSILQALNYWNERTIWKDCDAYDKEKDKITLSRNIAYSVKMAMIRILQDELCSYYYNFDSPEADEGRTYYAIMLRHCQNTGDLEHGYFLSGGVSGRNEEKYITMMLATAFKNRVNTIGDFLYYLLHGPATVTLYAKAAALAKQPAYRSNGYDYTKEDFSECFNDYMQVGRDISASRWARRANLILSADGTHAGALRLNKDDSVNTIKEWFDYKEKEVKKAAQKKAIKKNAVIATDKTNHGTKQLLAVLVSLSRTEPRENKYIISLYSYIAFMLKCCIACKDCTEENKEPLHHLISDYFSVKSSMYPAWLNGNRRIGTSKELFDRGSYAGCLRNGSTEKISDLVTPIAKEILEWYKRYNKEKFLNMLTPHQVGDDWAEVFYTMERIHSNTDSGYRENPFYLFRTAVDILSHRVPESDSATESEDSKQSETSAIVRKLSFIRLFPLTRPLWDACEELMNKFPGGAKDTQPEAATT